MFIILLLPNDFPGISYFIQRIRYGTQSDKRQRWHATQIFCEEENLSQNKVFVHLVSLTICTGFQDIYVKYNYVNSSVTSLMLVNSAKIFFKQRQPEP